MHPNPVRTTVEQYQSTHGLGPVTIDDEAIDVLGTEIGEANLSMPTWDSPAFPDSDDVDPDSVVDVLLTANALNFQFDHYDTDATFQTTYDGETFTGAFGLFACFTRALDAGTPVTSADYLASLDRATVAELFDGDPAMPMLPARHRILRHIGTQLKANDASRITDVLPTPGPMLPFDDGMGIVDRLVQLLPTAYNDRRTVAGMTIPFSKKRSWAWRCLRAVSELRDSTGCVRCRR